MRRPTQEDENQLFEPTAIALNESTTLPFVIPTEAQRSGGTCCSLNQHRISMGRSGLTPSLLRQNQVAP
jgi:hypothetical protein